MIATANTAAVLAALNDYTGDNIWQDVIYDLPGFDEEGTDAADPSWSSTQFVAGGLTYRWEASEQEWEIVGGKWDA